MALQCGTTSDGCQGKTGKYRIEYTLVVPSYVRYRYAGEAWQEVKNPNSNLTYRVERVSQPGLGQGVRYRIRVYTQANLRISDSRGDRYEGTYYPSFLATNQFVGPITSIVFRRSDSFGGANRNMSLRVIHAGGTTTFSLQPYSAPDGGLPIKNLPANSYWQLPDPPPDYPLLNLRITRIDGQSETDRWRFQVVDLMGNVVFTREETTQPEAIEMPEAYDSNIGSFVISNLQSDRKLKIVNSEANNRKSTSVLLGNTVIKKLDSPLGASLYPRVCWDCEEDKKCPEGTCTVECGDKICCYNSLGISVKEFKK